MIKTKAALLARGLDSARADALAQGGWTIQKIKLAKLDELRPLGLSDSEIADLQAGSRPPIPADTLTRLLFQNRYQCCVCRNPAKPIIVHHIVEWAKCRSHEIENLAVICLDHHQAAHSTSTLSQNLDPATLRGLKLEWELAVKVHDARAIVDVLRKEYRHWAYINELRLFELATEQKVDPTRVRYFDRAVLDGILDSIGRPTPVRTDIFYKYEGPAILTRYAYMKALFERVIERIPINNISDYLDKGVVFPAIVPGDFIFVQGSHTFSPISHVKKGIGQTCRGVRRANKVEIRFTFDRWEATSSSSKANGWLAPNGRVASFRLGISNAKMG